MRVKDLTEMLSNDHDLILSDLLPDEREEYEKPPYLLRGSMLTLIERMDEEFTKILKDCDAHSTEYVER